MARHDCIVQSAICHYPLLYVWIWIGIRQQFQPPTAEWNSMRQLTRAGKNIQSQSWWHSPRLRIRNMCKADERRAVLKSKQQQMPSATRKQTEKVHRRRFLEGFASRKQLFWLQLMNFPKKNELSNYTSIIDKNTFRNPFFKRLTEKIAYSRLLRFIWCIRHFFCGDVLQHKFCRLLKRFPCCSECKKRAV